MCLSVSSKSVFFRIVFAILLKDMKTRYGGNYGSYIVAVGWPLSHALFLLFGYILINSLSPLGDDPVIFAATGILPYILCFYPARMMPTIFLMNKQLLSIPAIKPIHLIFAAVIIELFTSIIVTVVFFIIVALFGVALVPADIAVAATALGVSIYFSIGVGVLNIILVSIFGPFYVVAFIIIMIMMYMTSSMFMPSYLISRDLKVIMSINPIWTLIEWLRSAYYYSYDSDLIRTYSVIWISTLSLLLGLLGERLVRNKMYM